MPASATPATPAPLACDHGLRRQSIVESILSDVFRGCLGPGQHLVTRSLAERFGVSHTPIREALIALSGMGVVDLLPNRGAKVRRVSPRDVAEIAQVRRLLECAATKSACGRIDLTELDAMRKELSQLKIPKSRRAARFINIARELDNRLHDLIAACCGNRFLAQELNRLKLLFRVFRDVAWEQEEARNDYRRLGEETLEHLQIIDALLDGNGKAASRAMSRHIRAGTRYWSRAVTSADSLAGDAAFGRFAVAPGGARPTTGQS